VKTRVCGIEANRNKNRNKFINQIRAPGGHIQLTIMIDAQQQYIKLNEGPVFNLSRWYKIRIDVK
jgi:hypothetical protein